MIRELLPFQKRWEEAWSRGSPNVHAWIVARDLLRFVHAEQSRILAAEGRAADVARFRELETRLEGMLHSDPPRDFDALFAELPRKSPWAPDPALFQVIPQEKLDRQDRAWELRIASEAHRAGWRFWLLRAFVEPARAQEFHAALESRLGDGTVLFVEDIADFRQSRLVGVLVDLGGIRLASTAGSASFSRVDTSLPPASG